MHNNYICIEGNIGSGKTTLVECLCKKNDTKKLLEEFDENPFLAGFYKNPERYAFQLELSFLAERFQQIQSEIPNHDLFQHQVIADYMIEKCSIFAKNNLDQQSFKLYRTLYEIMHRSIPKPDLILYLYKDVDLLMSNIKKRARIYEQNISPDYLADINSSYMTFFKQQKKYPVLIIDTNTIDFVKEPSQLGFFENLIKKKYNKGIYRFAL